MGWDPVPGSSASTSDPVTFATKFLGRIWTPNQPNPGLGFNYG
jgi:hypothetical protein